MDTTMDRDTLGAKLLPELQQIAQTMGVEGAQKLRKAPLIDAIVAAGTSTNGGGETKPARAKRTPKTADADESSTDAASSTTETTSDDADTDTDTDDDDRPARRERTDRPANADRGQDRGSADRGNADRGPRDGSNQDRDDRDRRRRPSREERRRQREERRVRDEADRAEEIKTAPSRTGILDILPEGYGFLRTSGYLPGPDDVYVSLSHVRKHQLRKGDTITGKIREPKNNEKYPALLLVESVNDMDPEAASKRPQFDKLTPLFPNERFRLENGPLAIAERIVDMVSPIGKGQRGMVVSPPKAGKTTILKQIANGIMKSSPRRT